MRSLLPSARGSSGEPGDQPVAAGKIAGARLPAERHLGDDGAVRRDGFGKLAVLGRVDAVMAAREHGDGAGREAAAVGGGVDATRQPRDHGEA